MNVTSKIGPLLDAGEALADAVMRVRVSHEVLGAPVDRDAPHAAQEAAHARHLQGRAINGRSAGGRRAVSGRQRGGRPAAAAGAHSPRAAAAAARAARAARRRTAAARARRPARARSARGRRSSAPRARATGGRTPAGEGELVQGLAAVLVHLLWST